VKDIALDYGNGFPINRKMLSLLALIGLGYLLLSMRPVPVRLSTWSSDQPDVRIIEDVAAQPGLVGVAQPQSGRGESGTTIPNGNPLAASNTIMTQGYGIGTHAPAASWGAVDLALDGDGDGRADPQGTWDAPIYATHAGVVRLTRNTWPAGNHIWIEAGSYKTSYSHLKAFAVEDGQTVKAGDLIGYVGASGQANGPHLDYQIWKDGVNLNPLDYGVIK
jgi:murein DD-endopeptidase MepM/ murein hydrolase activator NlpD